MKTTTVRQVSWLIAVCITLLSTATLDAQPLVHSEHDWSVRIAGHKFGIARQIQKPGDWQQTEIWLGSGRHYPETNFGDRVTFLIPGMKTIYVTHSVSRFVYELCSNENGIVYIRIHRWVTLIRRISLPYVPSSPRIFDTGK